jgi:aromatic-amino-acid transaminase
MATSLFAGVPMAPRDPTLGPTEAFNRDRDPNRVNLGVGIYLTDEGRIPVLRAVAKAEQLHAATAAPRGYLPIDGIAAYDTAVQALLLGESSPLIAEGRAITAQSLRLNNVKPQPLRRAVICLSTASPRTTTRFRRFFWATRHR